MQRDRERQRQRDAEMLRGSLPGALMTGKPEELSSRLSSEGGSIILSVCLVQGIELRTLCCVKCVNQVLQSELQSLLFSLSLVIQGQVLCPQSSTRSLGWAVKLASGLAVDCLDRP